MILYEEVLREFQEQKVKFIIVGGIAVNLLGSLRSTADLDILVEMKDDNLRKIVGILKNKGYRVKLPIEPMGIADAALRQDWIKNKHMKAFNFYKEDELKEVDIIIDSPVSYNKAKKGISRIKVDGVVFPVISIDNLIEMKQGTGRGIDKLDVEQLRKIKELKG